MVEHLTLDAVELIIIDPHGVLGDCGSNFSTAEHRQNISTKTHCRNDE